MADNEPVYAPDQLKTGSGKWPRMGAVVSVLVLLAMVIGNHEGNTENVFLVVMALGLLAVLGVDAALRRNGLR